MNGHVYVHMDLGSGSVKVRASRRRVDDGDWHELTLRRTGNNGRVTVDGSPAEFVTPGTLLISICNKSFCYLMRNMLVVWYYWLKLPI